MITPTHPLNTNTTRITRGDRPALQSFIPPWWVLSLRILRTSFTIPTPPRQPGTRGITNRTDFACESTRSALWELVLSRFWDLPMEISSRAGFVWLWWQRTPRHQTNASQGYRWFYSRLDSLEILTITHQPTDTLLCCIDQPCTSLKTGKAPGKLLKIFC